MKRYYNFKVKHNDMYDNLTPAKEPNIFKSNILVVLPNRDQFGRRVLLLELGSKYKAFLPYNRIKYARNLEKRAKRRDAMRSEA